MSFPKEFIHLNTALPEAVIDLRYATTHNITGKSLYASQNAYAHRNIFAALECVVGDLRKAGIGLKIWDAYRPVSVQWALWNACPNSLFIADPKIGSMHNRGLAVDVTLIDAHGRELAMPTPFDDFSPQAASDYPDLSSDIIANREFLKSTMFAYGFAPLPSEWWHFMMTDIEAPILDIAI